MLFIFFLKNIINHECFYYYMFYMKVKSSLKRRCKDCKIIKRGKNILVTCNILKHKQKQG